MKTLILIRGVPGSGKSTFAQLIQQPAIIIATDDYFSKSGEYQFDKSQLADAHTWCKDSVNQYMIDEVSTIVVNNTFTTESEMIPYFELAKKYGYQIHTIIMENRHNSQSIHNVPQEVIRRMANRFEIQLTPVESKTEYEQLVKIKEYGNLKLHKYSNKVFYNNLWHKDTKLLDARGLVLDSDDNIVQYPFTKIFNYGENNSYIDLDESVFVVKKINGFMAAVTLYKGEILVSTTGSLDSQYVDMAKEILPLEQMVPYLSEDYTYCFEIVHPNDPHIIRENVGAYLIGGRFKQYNSPQIDACILRDLAHKMGVYPPEYYYDIFGNVLRDVKTVQHEGYVVYSQDKVIKLKSPYYLSNKFIARCNKLEKIYTSQYRQYVDEEFYGLCEYLQQNFSQEQFKNIPEQERLHIVREWYLNQSM